MCVGGAQADGTGVAWEGALCRTKESHALGMEAPEAKSTGESAAEMLQGTQGPGRLVRGVPARGSSTLLPAPGLMVFVTLAKSLPCSRPGEGRGGSQRLP